MSFLDYLNSLLGPPDEVDSKAKMEIARLIRALEYAPDGSESYARKRCAAAEALGKTGNARAIGPLVNSIINDFNNEVRYASARALCKMKDEKAINSRIEIMQDVQGADNNVVRSIITDGLVKDGESAVGPLIKAIKIPGSENAREHYIDILGRLRSINAVEPLIAALGDSSQGIRYASASALGKIMDRQAVEPLIACLGDSSSAVRRVSAKALGELMDQRAVEPLIALLSDSDEYVSRESALALSKLMGANAIDYLTPFLEKDYIPDEIAQALKKSGWQPGDDEKGARYWIAIGAYDKCIALGATAVGPLIDKVKSGYDKGISAIISALAEIGDSRAVKPLINSLGSWQYFEESEAAIQALNKLNPAWRSSRTARNAVQNFISSLYGKSERDKIESTIALAEIGDSDAVGPIISLLRDSSYKVVNQACDALGMLKDPSAIEPLKKIALEGNFQAIKALEKLGVPDPNMEAKRDIQSGTITCPKCRTIYNRSAVIEVIRQQTPETFYFSNWTTKFICKACRTVITISSND